MSQENPLTNPVLTPSKGADDVWRVNEPVVELMPGETVTFDPGGMAARLWIPDRTLFDKSGEIDLLDRKPVTLRVSEKAPVGQYPYGFYLMDKTAMIEGESPPYIKIKRSTSPSGGDY